MTTTLSAQMLVAACDDSSAAAGITIETDLEPLAGDGAPVKPATYEGGRFQHGRRWVSDAGHLRPADVIVVDNEASQANRLEAALLAQRDELGLPDILLDLSSAGDLPPHLPRQISILQFPHRNADAYLRDSVLDGVAFMKSDVGQAIFSATADRADALLEWCPQAPLFGFWQSHLGKKRSQAKKARSWTSEIVGIEPAGEDVRRLGLKGDPLNLSVGEAVAFDENAVEEWSFSAKGKKLADVGHGQVPVGGEVAAPEGVSFREVRQQATVSFASLRTVRTSVGSAEARAVLVTLGLAAHTIAFGRSFSLRSGAELRPRSSRWRWLGSDGDDELDPLDPERARVLLRECAALAEGAGLGVGSRWREHRITIEPGRSLLSAIQKSWPVA